VQGKGLRFLQEGISLLWRWIGAGTVMLVEDLGTWPIIVEIVGEEEEWQRIGEWNTGEDKLRRLRTFQII